MLTLMRLGMIAGYIGFAAYGAYYLIGVIGL